jgi:hypothetical protein
MNFQLIQILLCTIFEFIFAVNFFKAKNLYYKVVYGFITLWFSIICVYHLIIMKADNIILMLKLLDK